MTQQLVATADGQQDASVFYKGRELRSLSLQLVAHDALLPVGAAADEDQINVCE